VPVRHGPLQRVLGVAPAPISMAVPTEIRIVMCITISHTEVGT
jgi:hypothetical protein